MCFRAAVAFSYVDRLLHIPEPALGVASGISTLESALPMLEKAGFMSVVYEDPYDVLVSLIRNIIQPDERGIRLNSTICLEAPKVNPHIPQMQATIAEVMGIEPDRISIKATTTEKLGFVGRREGVAAYATVLILRA